MAKLVNDLQHLHDVARTCEKQVHWLHCQLECMIYLAEHGQYGDYTSDVSMPISLLRQHLLSITPDPTQRPEIVLTDFMIREIKAMVSKVENGEYDE